MEKESRNINIASEVSKTMKKKIKVFTAQFMEKLQKKL